jgi:hypothetical protein
MKPSLVVGLVFGLVTLGINALLVLPLPEKTPGFILISGLLFFNTMFSVLFTKRANGYVLAWAEGFKAAIQSGILQGIFYYISVLMIQFFIRPGFFPELNSWKHYLLYFNIYIIAFSIFSAIFGFITSSLFHNKK